jgi:hypothetical protein
MLNFFKYFFTSILKRKKFFCSGVNLEKGMKGNILKYPYEASGGVICPLGGTFLSFILHESIRTKKL